MGSNVLRYLKLFCSTEPKKVDRLIISAFLTKNKIIVKNNEFLKKFIISKRNKKEYEKLLKFITVLDEKIPKLRIEELIELFEFVISPADRIVTGAIYTPAHIREFIVKESFQAKKDNLKSAKIADISCGCGGFLYNAAKKLKKQTNQSYFQIFKHQIFGLDIQKYSITRTKLLLTILAITEGEDKKVFDFNLFVGDALSFNWKRYVKKFTGFGMILGNPPYVCGRNLSEVTKKRLLKWNVCGSGNPDLYIPFFEIGIENLSKKGILGFITMNTFFKSLNGRDLRSYFQSKSLNFKILDFGTEQVFRSKNTYTCICLIHNTPSEYIQYSKRENQLLKKPGVVFSKIKYNTLDSIKGWNLQDNEIISKIESTDISFGKLYKTRHGIATLKNEIYIFNPVHEDKDYYYLQNGSLYQIEKGICKDIVNSNKLSRTVNFNNLKEKVIFPYNDSDKPKLLDEKFIQKNYPKAYKYLEQKRSILENRDKGKGEYENWFAFGRTQSLEKMKNKLFFPKMSDRNPSCIINADADLLFYNGLAIIGNSKKELEFIKKLMESRLFWYYISTTSKPYTSSYYSLNGNYIRNFGICKLSQKETDYVIKETDQKVLDIFFERKYGVKL